MRSLLAFWMGGAFSTPPQQATPARNIFRVDQTGASGDIFRVDQNGSSGKLFRQVS